MDEMNENDQLFAITEESVQHTFRNILVAELVKKFPVLLCRKEVQKFALLMEKELGINYPKSEWKGGDPGVILEYIYHNFSILRNAVQNEDKERIAEYCAYIGYKVMMIADLCGVLIEEGQESTL